ncbi:unnamed protein product [Musa acuminata subsp. malaccensis]|uniref:(wild Malaysian banana) hypothetical protein n=1 Tax=Musa acuminata subsp. malaccensis TaxID=214687 RepID=A0A804IKY0_MUSAM|nr:unnamed protein product [Musa acuminata subsp. malaccensis]
MENGEASGAGRNTTPTKGTLTPTRFQPLYRPPGMHRHAGRRAGPCDRGRRGEHRWERLHEDAFDADEPDVDDETFAMALQDSEEQEVAVRLMAVAGLNGYQMIMMTMAITLNYKIASYITYYQDAWQEVDPDDWTLIFLLLQELNALGEVVGTESRGLSADVISALPSVSYKANNVQDSNSEQFIICCLEYEDGDSLVLLSCKHIYHLECINTWLQINKVTF